ncbi:MAG: hypothetical protein H0V75_07035 [Rubrobacter sp.]|nr:hypothetical protein [Rubrobacter sp.]
MDELSLAHSAHPPPEQREESLRELRRRREAEVEDAEKRFADASRAYFHLVHEGKPERLERAAKIMDEAASIIRRPDRELRECHPCGGSGEYVVDADYDRLSGLLTRTYARCIDCRGAGTVSVYVYERGRR